MPDEVTEGSSPVRYAIAETALGWVGVSGSRLGVRRVVLPQSSREGVLLSLSEGGAKMIDAARTFGDLLGRIKGFLGGRGVSFADKTDLTGHSPFRIQVWEVARTIPYGETRSYAWVAQQLGNARAARAVGQALGANPVPLIVPCHRVITSDGGLGGFSGGLALKRRLLEIEAQPG